MGLFSKIQSFVQNPGAALAVPTAKVAINVKAAFTPAKAPAAAPVSIDHPSRYTQPSAKQLKGKVVAAVTQTYDYDASGPTQALSVEPHSSLKSSHLQTLAENYYGKGAGSVSVTQGAATGHFLMPAPPHPDAGNQELGPNMSGEDGIYRPGDAVAGLPGGTGPAQASSGSSVILIAGVALVAVLLLRRKK